MNHRCPPNGRKRRLTSIRVKATSSSQSQLPFLPKKRQRTSDSENSDSQLACCSGSVDMAELPVSPSGTNNHRLSLGNNLLGKGGINNHTKKSGQGKKLVIKNRKGLCPERFFNLFTFLFACLPVCLFVYLLVCFIWQVVVIFMVVRFP